MTINKIKKLLLNIVFLNNIIHCASVSVPAPEIIPGISGPIPISLRDYINILKCDKIQEQSNTINNILLLHGPMGNGKTTIAKGIAKLLDASQMILIGPAIVNTYQNSGAVEITNTFKNAYVKSMAERKKVVIIIDEIDAIASDTQKVTHNGANVSALQTLWTCLDSFKNNNKIILIMTTNKFQDLNKTFVSRIRKSNIIEITNPNGQARKEIIESYLKKSNIILDQSKIIEFVKASKGLNNRDIEDLICDAYQKSILHEELNSKTKDQNQKNSNKVFINFNDEIKHKIKTYKKINESKIVEPSQPVSDWTKASIIISAIGVIAQIFKKNPPIEVTIKTISKK